MKTKKLSPRQKILLIILGFAAFMTFGCNDCPPGDSMCIAHCVGTPKECSR